MKKPPPRRKNISKRYLQPRWNFLSEDKKGTLFVEGISVGELAKKYGTPLYILVEREIKTRLRRFKNAFPYAKLRPQYAGKINSNLEIMRIVREAGFDLDASSVGEIILGLLADFKPREITFTNLYKSEQDIMFATKVGVNAITADSIDELRRMIKVGEKLRTRIRTFLRINPLIDLGKYTTRTQQYGIHYPAAKRAIHIALANKHAIDLVGLHFHGSYIENPRVYKIAANKLLKLAAHATTAHGANIRFIDLGGGFPYDFGKQTFFTPEDMGKSFVRSFERMVRKYNLPMPTLIFEPGKFITANAGIGLMRIVSNKKVSKKNMVITDGSTYSFLPDPLLYKQYYDILPATKMNKPRRNMYTICGCTCDCVDKIAIDRWLPKLETDDLLAAMDCGAYSSVLASNFNTLRRAPMVLIKENQTIKLIRRRDRYSEMFAPELDVLKVAGPNELENFYNIYRLNIDKIWKGQTGNGKSGRGENAHPMPGEKIKNMSSHKNTEIR